MTTVLPGRAELCTGLTGSVSQRLRRLQMSAARRVSIERCGAVPASVPVWLSREAWNDDVRVWVAVPAFRSVCASLGGRGVISAATLVAVAVAMAEFADHATGRNVAVTNGVLAERAGCSERTVTTARTVLAAGGFAVEAVRGHGSAATHTAGNRPSIWHLVSQRQHAPNHPHSAPQNGGGEPADAVPDRGQSGPAAVDTCDLPPKAGSYLLPPVGNNSPSVRERAREEVSPSNHTPPRSRRRWRATTRPLAVQRLAAGLVTPAAGRGPDNVGRRSALIVGLDRGHIGAVCDAITQAGIDANAWTPKALASALEADGKSRGWSWPDRINRPGAFLASRLRRLPAQPDRSSSVDGGTAAGLEQASRAPAGPSAARTEPVEPTVPERVQTAAGRAFARQLFLEHQQRRLVDSQPPRESSASGRRSAPLAVVTEVAECALCGSEGAPRRRFLPAHRANVCDACWDQ